MQFVSDDAELHAGLRAEHGTGKGQPGIVGTASSLSPFFPFSDHLGALAGTSEFGQQLGVVGVSRRCFSAVFNTVSGFPRVPFFRGGAELRSGPVRLRRSC